MTAKYLLAELTVLITRPQHQAKNLQMQIEKMGGKTLLLPTIEIIFLHNTQAVKNTLENISQFDIAIFTSANAVASSMKHLSSSIKKPQIIAIGAGTSKALAQFNIHANELPTEFNSEGLLKLPRLQNVRDQRIVIFCGENSRPLLRETLLSRGAFVTETICYRRQKPNFDATILEKLKMSTINIVICTSAESLQNLYDGVNERGKIYLKSIYLLVISENMAAYAIKLGWEKSQIIISKAEDESMIKCLIDFASKRIAHTPKLFEQ